MALVLSDDEKSSFEGHNRIVHVSGPFTLFRLVGRTGAGAVTNKFGRFWFHDRLFWSVLDDITRHQHDKALMNFLIRRLLRELTAVCFDWNSFAAVYQLVVPAGLNVEAAVGRIRSQPHFATGSDPLDRQLFGDEFQFVIDVTASLQPLVQGPIPLDFRAGRA